MDHPPQPYQFHFRNVQLFKTDSLGTGSYGAVCKAMCDLLPCAAKLLHPILFQNSGPGARSPRSRFEQECHFLNAMKHPNIVQYLGTTQDPDSGLPVLLMELMDESLTRFLERSQQPLPYHVVVTLCHDIALALDYLHSNGVIHRDLSSNNVLLIAGSRAKVTDFGMSKLLSVNSRMTPYTTCPGTSVYMPPEALRDPPTYSKKIDCFSFGVIAIQILTRQFPDPGPASEMVEDQRYRVGRIQVPIPDSERRKSHIDLIDPAHPLLPMALRCINYSEEDRPSAEVLCREIALLREAPRYTQSLEQAQQRGGAAQGSERRLREENAQLSQQNCELRSQLETTSLELATTAQDLQATTQELQATTQELQQSTAALADSQRENQELRQELHDKEELLVAGENQRLQCLVRDKERQLRANEQVTAEFQQSLLQREETIRGLEEAITRLGQGPEEPVKGKRHMPEAKQMPLQQLKEQPQAIAQITTSQKHPTQEPTLPTPPRGMQREAAAADGEST